MLKKARPGLLNGGLEKPAWALLLLLSWLISGCATQTASHVPDIRETEQRADRAYAHQDWQEALAGYEEILTTRPGDRKAQRRLIRSALRADRPGLAAAHIERQLLLAPPDPTRARQLLQAHLQGLRSSIGRIRQSGKPDKAERRRLKRLAAAIARFEKDNKRKRRPRSNKPRAKSAVSHKLQTPDTAAPTTAPTKQPGRQPLPPYPEWLKTAPPDTQTIQLTTALSAAQIDKFISRHRLPRKQLYVATYRLNGIPHYVLLFGRFDDIGQAKKASEQLPLSLKKLWIRPARTVRAFLRIADQH